MKKYYCDNCGSTETYVKDFEDEYPVKGTLIKITSKQRFCSKCDCNVYDSYLDNITIKRVFSEYNKRIGLSPEKIVELRKNYNLSQAEFAKIIGCAKKTLVSYENGNSIPNDIYLVTIKTLFENPDIIKYLIDSNLDRYTDEEIDKINRKIRVVEKENMDYSEYNGYSDYSYDKISNMVSILTNKGILKTKVLKEMFYCDFISYRDTACGLTGLEYSKYNYGPVPCNFEDILKQLQDDGIITETIKYNGDYECHILKSNKVITSSLTEEEIDRIKKVKEYFKDFTVKEIVDYSHKEKAFIETDYYKKISYTYGDDISIEI